VEFKYLGAEEREIPALGLVIRKGDTFEATGGVAEGLVGQTDLFERTDKPTPTKKEK
jgi:hypothetical protein